MIKAINKQGKVSLFTERVWAMMAKDKNGFKEFSEGDVQINIPNEIKEFQVKVAKTDRVDAKVIPTSDPNAITATFQTSTPSDAAAEMDMMREVLAAKKIKHHPHLGYDNLKKLYDANK